VIGVERASEVGPVLVIGWILTALVGRRRPEPCAIDRLGRAVGWAWIVLWIARNILDESSLVRMWLASGSMNGSTVL
jgi:hypothetical protein